MPQERARKLADRIKVIVAETLETRIKDPRLGFITITDVRITNDLREATVFYTVLGTDEEREQTAQALESSKGLIRSEVGKGTGIKFTPTIEFVLDAVPENAQHVEALLKQAHEADEQVHAQAERAQYAGDADPYKHD